MVKRKLEAIYRSTIGILLAISFVSGVCALDNPESPDLIGEFEKREAIFLTKIDDPQNSTRDFLVAYDDYYIFLESEMNKVVDLLNLRLPEESKSELVIAQQHWVNYRDAEFEFIKNTWTRQNFGSSAGLSRGDYRTSIVKKRVMQLFHYAKNF